MWHLLQQPLQEGSGKGETQCQAGSVHTTCCDDTDTSYVRTTDSARAPSFHMLDALDTP